MPVPFRDLRDEDSLGLAGYFRFVSEKDDRGIRGALFLVNARGEPVDIAFSRIDSPAPFLWRTGDAKRHAVASLAAALLQACPEIPSLLLALADEVHPSLFTEDLIVEAPLCRVAEGANLQSSAGDSIESLSNTIHLFWVGKAPEDESQARRVLDGLQSRQLTTEPLNRAAIGIEEAFRE